MGLLARRCLVYWRHGVRKPPLVPGWVMLMRWGRVVMGSALVVMGSAMVANMAAVKVALLEQVAVWVAVKVAKEIQGQRILAGMVMLMQA